MMIKNICIIMITIILFSCKNKTEIVEEKLLGSWEIREMTYKKKQFKDSLYINTLIFEEEQKNYPYVVLPKTEGYESENSLYNIFKTDNDIFINIESTNPYFKGVHRIIFFKNNNEKLLGIEISSENLKIKAHKFHQDFNIDGLNW